MLLINEGGGRQAWWEAMEMETYAGKFRTDRDKHRTHENDASQGAMRGWPCLVTPNF